MGIVPELGVRDWQVSRDFYLRVLGFAPRHERPDEGFSYLERESAELMIDQIGLGRSFDDGAGPLVAPLGRGMNLQIEVSDLAPLLSALAAEVWPLLLPLEERWYRAGAQELGNRQIVLADPDGYLLRFFEDLGTRPAQGAAQKDAA